MLGFPPTMISTNQRVRLAYFSWSVRPNPSPQISTTQLSVLLPRICILVNERMYINRLVNDESTRNRTRDRDWDEFLKSSPPVSRSSDFINPSLLFLNVTNGVRCLRSALSLMVIYCKRQCCSFSSVLLVQVCPIVQETKAYGCHLVPYKDQRILYQERMLRLAQKSGCHVKGLADTSDH